MSDLLNTTLDLAKAKAGDVNVKRMCDAVGVSTRWFNKFMAGQIPDPSVRRVQRLHDYLTGLGGDAEHGESDRAA